MAAITADGRQELVALYLTMFGSAPSVTKLAEMVVARENGSTLAQVAATLSVDPAFALVASKDADSFATFLADQLLASDIPAAARTWALNWVVTQVSGTKSKATVIAEAVQAIRATTNTNYTTSKAALTTEVTASLAAIDGAPQVAGTFVLTTGQDYADATSSFKNGGLLSSTFAFSAGNETITAGAGSLGNTDALVDNSTTDADILDATLTSGAAVTATIQNIETINLTATIANSGLDFSGVMGAKTVTLTGAADAQLIDVSTTAGPVIAINNYSKALTLSADTFAGLTDVMSIKASGLVVSGLNVPTVTINNAFGADTLETLNLESAGTTKNTLAIAAGGNLNALTKAVVTGTADLELRVASGLVNGQTLDASAHTGVLTLSVDRNGATTATTNLTNATGVDAYIFRDTTAGGDALVASGLTNASNVTLTYGTTGASSLAVKGAASSTTNALTVTLDHATAATDTAVATSLTISDVETINFVSEGGTTTGNSIAGLTVTSASKLTVDGSTKLDLNLATTSLVASVTVKGSGAHKVDFAGTTTYGATGTLTIDGSAATGKLTLDASDVAGTTTARTVTILGGSADDTITSSGAQTLTKNVIDAGAGDDAVTVNRGTATNSTVALGAGTDTVNIVTLSGTGVVTFTDFALGGSGDKLSVDTGAAVTFGGVGAASVSNQLIISNAAVADNTAAATLVSTGAGAEAAIIVINNATGIAELWYDADGTAGGEVKLASFENITTVGALTNVTSGFIAANFGTWA